ncbi:MAG: hypothetical protein RL095_2772 [Verrucomicrobiota bacterium]|jgi:hypothetical protein
MLHRLLAFLPLGDATVEISRGLASARRGQIRGLLLSELNDFAREHGITDACIHSRQRPGYGFSLRIYGVPPSLHQRLRNIWGANR